jgi:hypothetical protein
LPESDKMRSYANSWQDPKPDLDFGDKIMRDEYKHQREALIHLKFPLQRDCGGGLSATLAVSDKHILIQGNELLVYNNNPGSAPPSKARQPSPKLRSKVRVFGGVRTSETAETVNSPSF